MSWRRVGEPGHGSGTAHSLQRSMISGQSVLLAKPVPRITPEALKEAQNASFFIYNRIGLGFRAGCGT